jgi:hypothetical protein
MNISYYPREDMLSRDEKEGHCKDASFEVTGPA